MLKQKISALEQEAKSERWYLRREDIQLEDKFASGSGGDIYRARWRGLICVAKTCPGTVSDHVIDDLTNEIKIWSTIRHPNLVQFLGAVFEEDSNPIILAEYCGGGDLESVLIKYGKSGTKVPTTKALKYAYQTAIGMNFLHSCQPVIIHRDLKPSNILLTKTGDIKITDFGLSKLLEKGISNQNYVMTGKTGSYRFMAPEVFNQEDYDEKVDVYSYSMVMYWVFAGVRPFYDVFDPIEVPQHVINHTKKLNTFPIKHKEIKQLLIKCWAVNASERPSFDEIWRETEQYSEGSKRETCTIS